MNEGEERLKLNTRCTLYLSCIQTLIYNMTMISTLFHVTLETTTTTTDHNHVNVCHLRCLNQCQKVKVIHQPQPEKKEKKSRSNESCSLSVEGRDERQREEEKEEHERERVKRGVSCVSRIDSCASFSARFLSISSHKGLYDRVCLRFACRLQLLPSSSLRCLSFSELGSFCLVSFHLPLQELCLLIHCQSLPLPPSSHHWGSCVSDTAS